MFNETPISPRKCRILLTKVIYLLYNGETFNRQEATTLFFGATKLFQHKDVSTKRAVTTNDKELTSPPPRCTAGTATDGLPGNQGALSASRRHDHGDCVDHEGHAAQHGGHLSPKRYSCLESCCGRECRARRWARDSVSMSTDPALSSLVALDGPGIGALLQVGHCGSQLVHLVCCPGIGLPTTSRCSGCGAQVGK